MALKDADRARLKDSPDLINFNRVLALFTYNAVAYVGAGKTVDEINERAKYAAKLTVKASADLSSPLCPMDCYWDEERSCCVCSGGHVTSAKASKKKTSVSKASKKLAKKK